MMIWKKKSINLKLNELIKTFNILINDVTPISKRTSWRLHSDDFLSVQTTSQVHLRWNTQWRLNATSPRCLSGTSLRHWETSWQRLNDVPLVRLHNSQTSLKWSTQWRLNGASPRRLSGTSPRCRTRSL